VIGLARRVGERGLDVIGLEIGEVTQNLVLGDALGQHPENIRHTNAQPPDARSPTALVRFRLQGVNINDKHIERLHATSTRMFTASLTTKYAAGMASSKKDSENTDRDDDIDGRIEKLKQEAAALSHGRMVSGVSPECPAEIEERFWKQVIAFENAPEVQPFEVLVQSGLALPPPEEMDDARLTVKLWETIHGLAFLGVYLDSTDHLSDRELYARLWSDILRQPTALQPDDPNVAWHVDLIGGGSEDEILLYLKYYADDEIRRSWAEEWPDHPLPDAVPRPFDRDRHLP
jgi:hypothetical protein